MKLTATMPVRNEDWCLGFSARVALMWCDELICLNHASTDHTADMLGDLQREYPGRVKVISVPETQWDEMQHRQMMLDWARANGAESKATHIAIVDADEILTGNLLSSIREHVAPLSWGYMLTLPLYNLRCGMNRYHLNGIWGQRIVQVAFKDVNTAGWKGDKFHNRQPDGVNWTNTRAPGVGQGQGGVMHLWGASERRLIAKHALYKITERIRFPHKLVPQIECEFSWAIKGDPGHPMYGTPATWTYADVPAGWIAPYVDLINDHLRMDTEPWQEAEARRLVELHGPEIFVGLDLFGVV